MPKKPLFAIIILCSLGIILYSNTLHNSFHLDDTRSIVRNLNIRNLYDLKAIWDFWPTRFATYLSIALNYRLNGFEVFGYHIFNLTIHICSAIMVFWFILLTSSTPAMKDAEISKDAYPIALLAGLIFISHPIQTEGVTYIVQRATSLATLFYLSSLILYAKSKLLGSLLITVLGMFTKEIMITLPLMIVLYEFCFFKTKTGIRWKRLVPFILTLLLIPSTMLLTKSVNFGEMRLASEPPSGILPIHYLLTQFRVMATYLRLLFAPLNQTIDYDYPIAKTIFSLPTISSILLLIIILIIAMRIFSKHRLISFGIFWFFLTILPESSVIPIDDVIFEHRLYLPMAGYGLFLASAIYYIFKNKNLKLIAVASVIVVASYSASTYLRNFIWEDELTLWNDAVRKSPKKPRPYNIRGLAYHVKGDFDKAISDYNKAIEIFPGYAFAYNNRGNSYLARGDVEKAIADCDKSITLNPNMAEAYYNRGNAYLKKNDFAQAIFDYTKAIRINPHYIEAYHNQGLAYQNIKNLDQAISNYNKTLNLDPLLAEGYYNRGNAYLSQGDINKAIFDYTRAVQINPGYAVAYNNRGTAYKNKGSLNEAISDYAMAIEINPKYAEAYNNRGITYKNKGELSQALADYSKAIELNPNYAEGYNNRANTYLLQGEIDQAISDYNKALQLNPNLTEASSGLQDAYSLKKKKGEQSHE